MDELSEYREDLPRELVEDVVSRYALGPPRVLADGGGTASPKLILRCGEREVLFRRRRREFSTPNRVRFDHAFIRHLDEALLPVAPPLTSRTGETWVRVGGHVFEIVPYIRGLEQMQRDSLAQLENAAEALARVHEASRAFRPPVEKDLGRDLYLPRYIHLLEDQLERNTPADSPYRPTAERMLSISRRVMQETERMRPDGVDPLVVHGDYTPANILFRADEVRGVFDFDWATRTSRTWDLCRGLLFFAFRRNTPLNPDDIASLTEAPIPDLKRARLFASAYSRGAPRLNDAEMHTIPLFVRETILCMRVGGMRKLPVEERLAYATREMEPLLDWMEERLDGAVGEVFTGA